MKNINTREIRRRIEEEYIQGGYSLGWAFLYSPLDTLFNANTVFLGLNPGGKNFCEPSFSCEGGSDYIHGEWSWRGVLLSAGTHPYQLQVQALFKYLDAEPNKVLCGNILPFRTPSWSDVPNRDSAVDFATKLWTSILTGRSFRIVTVGKEAENIIVSILSAKKRLQVMTGWGSTSARFYSYSSGQICCLPHLSRYQIFNRGKTTELEKALRTI